MNPASFAIVESPIGPLALAWRDARIAGLQLPEASREATAARTRRRLGGEERAPSPLVRSVARRVRDMLEGSGDDLRDVPLDFSDVSAFEVSVYEEARRIGPGRKVTYGAIATAIGRPGGARAVGAALGRNPFAILVPCHRVVAAGGRSGGFSAHGGVDTKMRLLALEGVTLPLGR